MAVVTDWLGYRRVSSVSGRDETLISPDQQAARIRAYADLKGYGVTMLPAELNVSGARKSRPILDDAIEQIRRGQARGIIVAALDRLSRMALSDALETIERIEGAGGQVVSVAENVDPTTPEGRLARNMFLSFAELQREQYRRHITGAKRQAIERGIWPVPVIPRGYVKGEDRRLHPGPDANVVREAFRLRAKGGSWSQVADLLGVGISGAAKIVSNRLYLGEIHLMIEGEVVVNPEAHEPLVSRGLWEAARVDNPRPPRGERGPSLLAGLIRCGHCSRTMSPGAGIYRCFPRSVAGHCPSPPTIKAAMVEEHVEEIVLSHLSHVSLRASPREIGVAEQVALEEAEAELAAYQEATRALADPALFVAGLKQRAQAVEEATAALGRLRRRAVAEVPFALGRDAYERLDVEARRHVLRDAIGVVWIWKGRGLDRVAVVERGFEPPILSGPGVSVPLTAIERGGLPGEVRIAEVEGTDESGG